MPGIPAPTGRCFSDPGETGQGSGSLEAEFRVGKPCLASMPRAADLLLGGWQLTGIVTFAQGQFQTPALGPDWLLIGNFTQSRPDPLTGKFIPDTTRNQFGASLGGPIQKDKIFIFGDYSGLRSKVGGR